LNFCEGRQSKGAKKNRMGKVDCLRNSRFDSEKDQRPEKKICSKGRSTKGGASKIDGRKRDRELFKKQGFSEESSLMKRHLMKKGPPEVRKGRKESKKVLESPYGKSG